MVDVSVIIVNYNTRELTSQCIESIYKYSQSISFEIILVDNNSYDNSLPYLKEKFPELLIIHNENNLGFGRANNIGAAKANGRYLFFLNSDTILIENVISSFFKFMETHNNYASCGCNLVNTQNAPVPSHGNLPSLKMELFSGPVGRFLRGYFNKYLSPTQTINEGNLKNPGYIAGADIFIRKEVFESLKGFDSNIFMYFEETDLYYRMKKNGFQSVVLPQLSIIHLGGGSFTSTDNLNKFRMMESSRSYYYKKNYSRCYSATAKLVRAFNILLSCQKNKKEKIKIVLYT